MSVAKFPDSGEGRPVSAVRLARFAAECGWDARISPPRTAGGRQVIRLTLTRGQWPGNGSWEVQMNWDAEVGSKVFERRHAVFGRKEGGPWLDTGATVKDAMAIMDRHRWIRAVKPLVPKARDSVASQRFARNRR
jgi:hypothetical protein